MSDAFRAIDLVMSFRDLPVLNGLNLNVQEGSVYGLVGPNGAGKTTTIKILMNIHLILNSRDAMLDGGRILISTGNLEREATKLSGSITESFVRLIVTDSGPGIAADIREHVFDPFFTTKPHGKGAGLGLAIVYGIVKEAGGEIAVLSSDGAGASFEILLPRVEEAIGNAPGKTMAAVTDHENPRTLLLVEDQDAIRALLHNYFEKHGFRVIEAENGHEALALANVYEGKIEVLISDVMMPNMDGPTLSRALTAIRPDMKTILISGQPGHAMEALQCERAGWSFLQKPFTLPRLMEKMNELTA